MIMATKKDIFDEHKEEYWKSNKMQKGEILKHIASVTKMHKKSVTRRFSALQKRDPAVVEKRGRKTYYDKGVDAAVKEVWEAANEPCGELLHPLITEYVHILKRDKMWLHGDITTGKLLCMGEHTVRRRVGSFERVLGKKKGLSATKPSHLKSIIPIFKGPWSGLPPGNGQLDTVAHCGNTLLGDFVFTLNYTDMATYWVIPRAQWNKGAEATVASMKEVLKLLPVPLLQIHPDTGSEFINWSLKGWCDRKEIKMTRSEPGK